MSYSYNQNNVLCNYPDVLTVNALSTILQVSTTTCYSLIKNNEIRSIRIGNQIRIPKIYLFDYLYRKEPMAV
jgi:excisionase family DNA binding protein